MDEATSNQLPERPVVVLEGEVVVVTGAGSRTSDPRDAWGIGAAIAGYAAAGGASVGILDADLGLAEHTVARIAEWAPSARTVAVGADVTSVEQVAAAFERVRGELGPISGVVNNVGIGGPRGTAADLDLEHWATTFDVNVTSVVVTTRIALADLEATRGSVVNISSVAGIRGGHHALGYPTTKAAIVGMTQTMAAHHGPDGVRFNTVAPGLAYTPMVTDRGLTDEARERRAKASMMQTEGTAWDIAAPVAFLLSRAAAWVTGVTLPVDAGLSALAPNLGVAQRNG